MRDRPKKRPRDPNQLAKFVVDVATSGREDATDTPDRQGKNAAAVELGRLGGLKGGRARADSLSADVRAKIAKKAAQKRWGARSENGKVRRSRSDRT